MHDPTTSTRGKGQGHLDHFGLGLAGLCAVHCVLTIVLVSALGFGSHFLLAPEIHRIGFALAMIVAAVAIGRGALIHRRAMPFVVAMMGLTFMGGALAMPHGNGELMLTLIGIVLVSAGHLLNLHAAYTR